MARKYAPVGGGGSGGGSNAPEGVSQQTWDSLSDDTKWEVENEGGVDFWMENVGAMFTNGNPFYNHPSLDGVLADWQDAVNDVRRNVPGSEERAEALGRILDLDDEMRDIAVNTRGVTDTEELLKTADRYFQADDEIIEIYDEWYY